VLKRRCDHCGNTYVAKTKRSKYCHTPDCDTTREREKKQNQRAPKAKVLHLPTETDGGLLEEIRAEIEAGTVLSVLVQLKAADRLDTVAGRQAVALARRIDFFSMRDTGSSYAALHRQLTATLELALADAKTGGPVDELREKRLERLGLSG